MRCSASRAKDSVRSRPVSPSRANASPPAPSAPARRSAEVGIRQIGQVIAGQDERRARSARTRKTDQHRLDPGVATHAAEELAEDRAILRREKVDQRLADDLLRVPVDQRLRGARREGDPALAIDLEQDVCRAEGERHEPVAFALERFEVALAGRLPVSVLDHAR
jgi:hypothetical protein